MDLEGKWKAIITGGVIIGLAPFVPFLNLACCLIPMVGAIVAVAVYRSSTPPPPLSNNDGVVLGAMSGVVGTALYGVLVAPITLFLGSALGGFLGRIIPDLTDVPARVRPLLEGIFGNFGNFVGLILFFKLLSQLALSLVFGIIGGLVGVAILKSRPTPPGAGSV